ncbi:MAG: 2-C-methyl-D-erythritol 2,4-cyclodiphosphate synthase [Chloroflexota bacterium]
MAGAVKEVVMRIGIGYDIHPLATGHPLVLGGVTVPFDRGLEGWSDGDTLTHAVIDALLGAAALGDIGTHFPPGEAQYRGIRSLVLLGMVKEKLAEGHWKVVNIDATMIAEQPHLADFFAGMRQNLSATLDIPIGQVNIKASSSNSLGVGIRGEGIAVHAVALIEKDSLSQV